MTDQQQAPLQAAPDPAPTTRTRNPVYAVYVRNETKAWSCMNEARAASSRQEAILAECRANNEPDREGEFMVIPVDAIKIITRKIKKETVSEFN